MTERQTIPIRIFSAQDNALLENQLCLLKDTLSTQTHYYRQELAQLYFKSMKYPPNLGRNANLKLIIR